MILYGAKIKKGTKTEIKPMTQTKMALGALGMILATPVWGAGDFPLASCKGWDGPVSQRGGIDTSHAWLKGVVTQDDLLEYCTRDPGGETNQYGGKLSVSHCVEKYMLKLDKMPLLAEANCSRGVVVFRYGKDIAGAAKFPLAEGADISCASGMPPAHVSIQNTLSSCRQQSPHRIVCHKHDHLSNQASGMTRGDT